MYDNKSIKVYQRMKNDSKINALKMSGYESLMINIAFRLALGNLNKQLKTNFMIMDEAFTFCDD